jgi:hypothetical protein
MIPMTEYEIGYGKPPKHAQFKVGNNANPKGRRKRKPDVLIDIINDVSNGTTKYIERGRTKKATWAELALRKRIKLALGGNLRSIDALLKQLMHAQRAGDSGVRRIKVLGGLPDFPGQTAEQKTRQFAERGQAEATEGWKPQVADSVDKNA